MIVAGPDLVASLFLEGSETGLAERVFDRDCDWCAPLVWRSLFHRVLAERHRAGEAAVDAACAAIRAAESIFRDREFQPNGEHVLRLAIASGGDASTCEFVAVARDLGVPVVTADDSLIRAFPGVALAAAAFVRV